jgi:hypothetical protein
MIWLLCTHYRNRVKGNSSASFASLVHVSFASPTAVARLRSLSHSVSEIIGESMSVRYVMVFDQFEVSLTKDMPISIAQKHPATFDA